MTPTELKKFSDSVTEHLFGHILPFWSGPALDEENGGWMGWLSNELKPDRKQPKGLILNSRILWTFSALHRARPQSGTRQLAERAFAFLMDKFRDARHGGAYWQLNDRGEVIDDSKKIYGQAFCIYALSEFFQAHATPEALAGAADLFELLERHARDEKFGGYFEVCNRDWSPAGPGARLSGKDLSEKKSMNNHLHLLEAFTNLYRVRKEPRVGMRLRELVALFQGKILDDRTGHFHHFFDEEWRVRSDTYTFGHDIEGSWLLCEAAEALADAPLLKSVRATALRLAETVFREGLEDGGLCYEGKDGEIIDRGKEWWPQAEAMVGFLNAWQLSGEDRFLSAARGVWDFIQRRLVDRVRGDWFWRITPEGRVDGSLPKVSEWKGPYHSSRACLETIHRLQMISKAGI